MVKPIFFGKSKDADLMRSLIPGSENTESSEDLKATSEDSIDAPPPFNEKEISQDDTSIPASIRFKVGLIYAIRLHELDESVNNARYFYRTDEIEDMAYSLISHGQEQAASGYIENDKVYILDGVKRLRGARAAGLERLRVDIREKPDNDIEGYLISRRMNTERSNHTCLDDAIKFKGLLEKKVVNTQAELAKQTNLSEGTISQTLSLNRIPLPVLRYMKERPAVSGIAIAYQLTLLFPKNILTEPEDVIDSHCKRAFKVIDEIVSRGLAVPQVRALIKGILEGPIPRVQSEIRSFNFGENKGIIKVSPVKNRLDITFKNIPSNKFDELREKIEKMLTQASL